jgi:hypothetical protein
MNFFESKLSAASDKIPKLAMLTFGSEKFQRISTRMFPDYIRFV